MHFTSIVASALLLLAEVDIISAKAIFHLPNAIRRRTTIEDMDKVASNVVRRASSSSSGLLSVAAPSASMNQTIANACTSALTGLTKVDNDAGFAACYNIMQYDATLKTFQADLRLYQMFQPSGDFQNISVNNVFVSLTYPTSTTFQSLTKRKRDLLERQSSSNMAEIQQYSLIGSFQANLEVTKLNDTQTMSLMLPDIKLGAVDELGNLVSANVSSADGAWFVVGQFANEFKDTLVGPTVAAAAIAAAAPFVLPGTHLGIFPTGLIVTCSWTFLFLLAYGFGTLGRIRYRKVYRQRKAAQAGRTGKRI